jgi:uncharacterized membrane protein
MTLPRSPLALLFTALLLPACGGEPAQAQADPDVDCGAVKVPTFPEVSAFHKCINCHSTTKVESARQGAPAGVDYDTYAAAMANAHAGMEQVYKDLMPPPGYADLNEAEKNQIYRWASCDTPQ